MQSALGGPSPASGAPRRWEGRSLSRPPAAAPPAPPAPPAPRGMNLSSSSSAAGKAPAAVLWGCELTQEKRTWTVQPQKEGKQDWKLLLCTICLGEKATEEVNLVEILPPASPDDKQAKPITIASLQASVLPMVVMMGLELSPPVTFQLRAGSGPVFLSGQECYNAADVSWEEEEEDPEEEEEEEEEESHSDEVDDDDDDDDDVDVSLEETPVKQVKRLASQKQTSVAKKKRMEKEEEAVRPRLKDQSPVKKAKPTLKPKKPGSKK
ncbi:nucleoplasmin-2 isoform X3 [Vulpes vulpes]|uniref:Nucleoplasmin-2 isoform X3 n=1 Tax=Vulpes vulpes TaxID=9627 RepID=A0ABM4XBY5_VULVU